MEPLEQKLAQLHSDIKVHFDKAAEETKLHGAVLEETKTNYLALQKQVDAIDLKLAERIVAGPEQKGLADLLKENDDVSRLVHDKKGRATLRISGNIVSDLWEGKAITTPARITPNVVNAERLSMIVPEARRALRMRDVLSARPTTAPLVYWVKVNSPLVGGSPLMQVEAGLKYENTLTFTVANSPVKTIGTFIRASRQALDDFSELDGFLRSSLPYYVNQEEERQLLSGTNTGEDLNGLAVQATSFNTALLTASAGYTRLDQIAEAIDQIGIANEIPPTFVVLNTQDWWKLRRLKDTLGRYILGDPTDKGNPTLWGLDVVSTNAIAQGTFLVGSGSPVAAEIRDRMEMEVAISTEDSDNFERNLVTIRAEKRMVLCVFRPGSFVSGTFASSPTS